jgi:hypothetical protein
MSKFKPQATFVTRKGIRDFQNGYRKTISDVNIYPTYGKLKKELPTLLKSSHDNFVSVVRSKRGEWGEWYEHWMLVNGVPTIVKEGWN